VHVDLIAATADHFALLGQGGLRVDGSVAPQEGECPPEGFTVVRANSEAGFQVNIPSVRTYFTH
jgi:hypothetical protein